MALCKTSEVSGEMPWRDYRLDNYDNYIIINCILHAYFIHYDKPFEYSYFDKVLLSLYRKIFTSINLKGL